MGQTLFFTAGINAEQNGLFGSIRALQPTPPPDDGDDDDDDDDGKGDGGGRRSGLRSGSDGGQGILVGQFLPPETEGEKVGRRARVWVG